jgi:hypothetical protein
LKRLSRDLQALAVTLWVGSLWTTGLLTAPALFRSVPDRMLAGAVAGRLFTVVAFLGLGCAICVIALDLVRWPRWSRLTVGLAAAMAALTALGEVGIQPMLAELKAAAAPADVMESAFASRFARWHGIASGVYLLNCVMGGALVVAVRRASA